MAVAARHGAGPSRAPSGEQQLAVWLTVIAAMVALTAVIGAATRLTGSGLSITEWQPIMGVIPPLTDADWQVAFDKYRQIPQYLEVNRGMSLAAFQVIYWWEWGHRMVARAIGVVFLVPFVVFLVRGRIPQSLVPKLIVLFGLGILQATIGWIMVRSGLTARVSVAPIKLMLHLGCAVLIFALLVWMVLDLVGERHRRAVAITTPGRAALWLAAGLVALVYMQILSGALVAGNKAGLTYNTWPLMDGRLVPSGLKVLSPWWLNLFENVTTVQFNHRMLAYVVVALGLWQAMTLGQHADDPAVRRSAMWLGVGLLGQMALGVWTLLAWVPISLGLAHQFGALIALALALWHLHAVMAARRV